MAALLYIAVLTSRDIGTGGQTEHTGCETEREEQTDGQTDRLRQGGRQSWFREGHKTS